MNMIRNTSLAYKIDPQQHDSMFEAAEASAPRSQAGGMQAELGARLTAAEYERWLLPPEPRDAVERVVHALSLGAGVLALTSGAALLWLVL